MQFLRASLLAVLGASALFAIACGNSTTSATTVSSLSVTGTAPAVGATAQFNAVAMMGDGSTEDVTSLATWSSSDTAVATASATGLVTGVAAGSATLTATYQSISASDAIVLAP